MSEVRRRKTGDKSSESSESQQGVKKDRPAAPTGLGIGQLLCRSCVMGTITLLLAIGLFLFSVVKANGGLGGDPFPDRTTPAHLPGESLSLVATLDTPPGNLAVSETGRVFFTFHPEYRPIIKVAEWVCGDDTPCVAIPYPNSTFQGDVSTPLALRISRGHLFVLDFAEHVLMPWIRPRLVQIDLETDQVVRTFIFPPSIAPFGAMLNDFNIDPSGRFIYLADTSIFGGTPSIIVLDWLEQRAWRVMEGHSSLKAELYTPVVNGTVVKALGFFPIRPHVDSIALDREGVYLYYSPVAHSTLFRVPVDALKAGKVSSKQVEEVTVEKPMTDGITLDWRGTVYGTDIEHGAIAWMKKGERKFTTLIQDPRLHWPDGFSFGPKGSLYFTCSYLHWQFTGTMPPGPYPAIWRIDLPEADGTVAGQ